MKQPLPSSELFKTMPFDNVMRCIHCGMCADACPTYRELGMEQDSPRGRLYIMRGLWEGDLQPEPAVIAPLSRCLDCRACETVCPSLVPYGELIEKTRGVLNSKTKKGLGERFLRGFLLKRVLASTSWLVWFSRLSRFYQASGLARFLAPLLPKRLRQSHRLMPTFAGASFKRKSAEKEEAQKQKGAPQVGLFTGCVMDIAEHQIHQATVEVLEALGFAVRVPQDQGCCGALQVHQGEREMPRQLARRNAAAFAGLDRLVVNAAGCGAQLKEYAHLFSELGEEKEEDWQKFRAKVVDILALLAERQDWPRGLSWQTAAVTVLYDAPCHLIHAQGIDAGPRKVLAELPGVTLVALAEASRCCGAAGIYNLQHPELADAILDRKLDDIQHSLEQHPEAAILVTGNPGCLFQLRHGVRKRILPLRVIHPVELIAERMAL